MGEGVQEESIQVSVRGPVAGAYNRATCLDTTLSFLHLIWRPETIPVEPMSYLRTPKDERWL